MFNIPNNSTNNNYHYKDDIKNSTSLYIMALILKRIRNQLETGKGKIRQEEIMDEEIKDDEYQKRWKKAVIEQGF